MHESNIHIIAIDGLDGTGKSTFAKRLYNHLKKIAGDDTILLFQHFPVYENNTGKEIKEFLKKEADLNNDEKVNHMIDLQIRNRAEWWIDLCRKYSDITDENKRIILIADRYKESNVIYNAFGTNSNNMSYKAFDIYKMENNYPQKNPDIQLLVYCDPKLQMERLSARNSLDRYESPETVAILNNNYCEYVNWFNRKKDLSYQRYPSFCIPLHWFDKGYVEREYSDEDKIYCEKLTKKTMELIAFYTADVSNDYFMLGRAGITPAQAIAIKTDLARAWAAYSNTAK